MKTIIIVLVSYVVLVMLVGKWLKYQRRLQTSQENEVRAITLRYPPILVSVGNPGSVNFCDQWYIIGMGGTERYGIIVVARDEPTLEMPAEDVDEVLGCISDVTKQFLNHLTEI